MPDQQVTEELEGTDSEVLYRWTIRTLYVLAIALNVYMLVDQMKDSEEWAITRRRWQYRVAGWRRKAEPAVARLDFRRHADAVVSEAERVVDGA